MRKEKQFPGTLQEVILYFADYENCHQFLVDLRWPDGKVKCPRCGSGHVTYLGNARVWKCYEKHERPKFSLKVGTIFEDSPVALDKWLAAVWMIVNCKNGISSYEIARALDVTQKTAWFMDHRIRFALHQGSFDAKMGGEGSTVEADETYIGGKARNMHLAKRKAMGFADRSKTGGFGKVAVFGLLQRHGAGKTSKVRAKVIGKFDAAAMKKEISSHVETGSTVYTDEHGGYSTLGDNGDFIHDFVRHAECYVKGNVHNQWNRKFLVIAQKNYRRNLCGR